MDGYILYIYINIDKHHLPVVEEVGVHEVQGPAQALYRPREDSSLALGQNTVPKFKKK